ncbi:MOSC domain-containing protein [Microlunatus lacustris]
MPPGAPTLTSLVRYPLKSGRAETLAEAVVEPWGLAGDRRWMVVDAGGRMLTGRQVPELVLVVATAGDDGLVLSARGRTPVRVATPAGPDRVPVDLFGSRFLASPAPGAEAWLTAVLGRPAQLLHLRDPRGRAADPAYAAPGDVVSLADGFPLMLTNEASLAALEGWVAEGPRPQEAPLGMGRFRPNLVVTGAPAWAEDRWRRLRIGDVSFRAVKACERCAFTLVDPATAARTKEPLASLARHRRYDGKTWFGVNLVPEQPLGRLRVGDAVEVTALAPEPGPLR